MKKKTVALLLALVLVVGSVIGGTLAWLVDSTQSITNTFTVGNVDITLTETDAVDNAKSFKMVPGNTIAKDPEVTVEADSEACWLFVQVDKAGGDVTVNENGTSVIKNFDNFITYTIDSDWKPLDGHNNVYYREVSASAAKDGISYYVLQGSGTGTAYANGCVTVNSDVTKDMMDALNEEGAVQPTLTFTAYAVQSDNVTTAAAAWAIANPATPNP